MAIRAYAVYESQAMLDVAVDAWEYGRKYTISGSEASAGKSGVKAFDLAATCEGGKSAFSLKLLMH